MFIEPEIVKELVGTIGGGPAGFNVKYDVASGANIGAGNTAEVKINDQSLQAAQVRNNSGVNAKFAADDVKAPKGVANALAKSSARQSGLDDRVSSILSRTGYKPHQPNRRMLTNQMQAPQPKNALHRMQQRHYLALRKTFDEILKRRTIALNPQSLPQQLKQKMVQAAAQRGDTQTALGIVPQKGSPNLRAAIAKWSQVGSYIPDLAPTNKA